MQKAGRLEGEYLLGSPDIGTFQASESFHFIHREECEQCQELLYIAIIAFMIGLAVNAQARSQPWTR